MPVFTPARRWQPRFYPFKKDPFGRRLLGFIEYMTKGPLFGCRMCGNCLLQETALICPMECPKGLRNGPCGGSTPEYCYVDKTRPCIWYKIYERAFKWNRQELLLEVLPPLDWDKVGTDAWWDGVVRMNEIGWFKAIGGLISAKTRKETWDSIFVPIRQPTWWQGDSEYHPPKYSEPMSELERRLRAGEFVVTSEVAPPLSTATGKLKRDIDMLKPYVTSINFTDAASAMPKMSSFACSVFALEQGAEPVLQIAARDVTRIGLQGQVLGASALGIRNILVITGDSARLGETPMSRNDLVDLDSVQMLWILRRMRDEGIYLGGRPIKNPPKIFIGAAASPFASEPHFQALREHKKVNAGAQFFQTNLVFDINGLETWLNALAKRNILGKVYILVGITPLKSYKMAKYLDEDVPGVKVPQAILKRLEAAGEEGAPEEGFNIAMELIQGIRKLEGVNGIHLMPVYWEDIVPRIVQEAGLQKAVVN